MISRAEKAVIAVVAYSAQFDHPLTIEEISQRLLRGRALRTLDESLATNAIFKEGDVVAAVRSLLKRNILIQKNDWFTLSGKQKGFQKRRAAMRAIRGKEHLIAELVALAQDCSWIYGIAITGSYAAGGAGEKDDVDFLMVTQKNRLWLTRLWLLYQAWRRGRRPHIPGDISHSWDLNFWLDETRLAMPRHKQAVYEAYEILQTRWVFERNDTYAKFLAANQWVSRFLVKPLRQPAKSVSTKTPQSMILSLLDGAAFILQVGYRTLRHGRQKAALHSAFFHPTNTRENIFFAWKSLYDRAVRAGTVVVLATGVFDVLHAEHKNFLKKAKAAGDTLFVGIESDKRVRELKGVGRPINKQVTRKRNIERWKIADEVFILPENFNDQSAREALLANLKPNILAVSSSTPFLERKRQLMKKFGGVVKVVHKHNPRFSTTQLLNKKA